MSDVKELGSTTIISDPSWTGFGFAEPEAQAFWLELPPNLQALATREIAAGNVAHQILRNHERGIVLVAFVHGPLTGQAPADVVVHSTHRYGNYCYDDTTCTYEDKRTGSFLAFLAEDADPAPPSAPPNER